MKEIIESIVLLGTNIHASQSEATPVPFTSWKQQGARIEGDAANDKLGNSVALSADASVMAIGASNYKGQTGYVEVYHTNDDGKNWAQLGQTIYGDAFLDDFGEKVKISRDGMTIVCSSPSWSSEVADRPGYVRVFSFEGDSDLGTDTWKQIGQDIIGEEMGDEFGDSISISDDGKTIAVGASLNDGVIGYSTGHVRVYRLADDGTIWEQIGQDIDGEAAGDGLGQSVSLSADGLTVAIAAPWNNKKGVNSGQVTVRRFNDEKSSWEPLGQSIYGDNENDYFGWSTTLSPDGDSLAIGSPGDWVENDRPGYVRVFSLEGDSDIGTDSWTQIGKDIVGDANGDEFGISISVSYDGKTLAVGAQYADGKNGVDSGCVRVYRMDDSELDWIQLGDDIIGEAADDFSGYSVSLSADGNKVAIGAQGNDDNGELSGHVSVFALE